MAVSSASRTPTPRPEKPPLPEATSPTPTNDNAAAAQKLRCTRSNPMLVAMMAIQIGVVPSRRAAVEALDLSTP